MVLAIIYQINRSNSPAKQEPKVVLITGAAKRIGAHIAKTLHDAEMRVLVHYHQSATAAERLVEDLNNGDIIPNTSIINKKPLRRTQRFNRDYF